MQTIPFPADPCPAEQSNSIEPPLRTLVSSAMIAKVGVAARRIHLAISSAAAWQDWPGSWLLARIAFPKGGLSGVRHLDPLHVGRGVGDVTLVPVPPFVGPALWVAFRR